MPESRQEVTTEGGLDRRRPGWRASGRGRARSAPSGIRVSLFIDPDPAQIEAARRAGAPVIELHTGAYADASGGAALRPRVRAAAQRCETRRLAGTDGQCGPWPQLPQRRAHRRDRRKSSNSTSAIRSWRAPSFDGLRQGRARHEGADVPRAGRRMIFGIGIDVLRSIASSACIRSTANASCGISCCRRSARSSSARRARCVFSPCVSPPRRPSSKAWAPVLRMAYGSATWASCRTPGASRRWCIPRAAPRCATDWASARVM